ncbi:MAG: hypothetical protein MUP11_11570 [Anaerolineales bacterium]|nr:hypothetical protein [Anaerolineales bacterium]
MTEPQLIERETIPLEKPDKDTEGSEKTPSSWRNILFVVLGLLIIGLLVAGIVFLVNPGTDTAKVRDIFIIFMALEFLAIGIVMIILIIQLARLTLLLQNEIKPILDSTSQTANTLRGTTAFLSEHMVEPVLKMNQYLAGLNRILGFFKSEK